MIKFITILFTAFALQAATYYVSTSGDNANPGSDVQPFLTFQKGIDTAQAGDTVLVGAGVYNERGYTKRNGSAGSPITLNGQNVATIKGVNFTNSYINFINFRVAGETTTYGQALYLKRLSSYCVLSNNVIDGEYIPDVNKLRWEPPATKPFDDVAAHHVLVISNTFINHNGDGGRPVVWMYGNQNVFYGNKIIDQMGGDCILLWGGTNYIVGNVFSNLFDAEGLTGHPDWIQSYGLDGSQANGSRGHIIESNLVTHFHNPSAQILMTESWDDPEIGDWTFRNNVLIGIPNKATMCIRDCKWYNNTFYHCGTNIAGGKFVLNFGLSRGVSHGGRVFNNAFIDCAELGSTNSGWYVFNNALTNVAADFNFVSKDGLPVRVDPQQRPIGGEVPWEYLNLYWWEPNGLNGGSPKFISTNALDFRLQPSSPLVGAATNLSSLFTTDITGRTRTTWDIGAYEYYQARPGRAVVRMRAE